LRCESFGDELVILKRARQSARLAGFVAITSTMLALYLSADAVALEKDRDRVRDVWTRRWSRALLRLFGINREIEGICAPATRGRLVVANHRSTIDIGIMLENFGGRMVSRADLAKWPVIGIAARKSGTVFVDRSKKSSGAAVIRAMSDLLSHGHTVCVFPEGTTFADDEVRSFHPGGFVAAARARAEIIPVGIVYDHGSEAAFVDEPFMAHLARLAGAAPSRVKVVIGKPIDAAGDARALAIAVRDEVQSLVNRGRASF
jgi:1-acyl-sn-glycerol-3-phosphate acyltransferase